MFIDIVENRLKMAKKLGADDTYLIQKDRSEKDTVADIHAIFGDEPNKTLDASGAQASVRLAILVSFKISM
jgi:L-iditol 2-dehydrogenase